MSFRPSYEVFLAKNRKTLNVGKIRKYDEKRLSFREKNVFIFLKAFFTKMEGANMPVVAGRLVTNPEKTYDNSYSYVIENTKIMLHGCLKSTTASFAFAKLASTKIKNRTIEKL